MFEQENDELELVFKATNLTDYRISREKIGSGETSLKVETKGDAGLSLGCLPSKSHRLLSPNLFKQQKTLQYLNGSCFPVICHNGVNLLQSGHACK